MTNIVVIERVSKTYGTGATAVEALQGIDVTIAEGEIVALLGPSGCGKSTLLKLVGGLYSPTSGRIILDGAPLVGPSPEVGFMFQSPVLFPWLTVLENALLPPRISGVGRKESRDKALDYIDMVGLSGFQDRYPWELSGGMQQRAAICRMLMTDPRIFLLDEPFGALDEFTREYLDVEMRSIVGRTGRTAIFVTHSIAEAVFLADRVLALSDRPGRVAGEVKVELGTVRKPEVFASDELVHHVRELRELLGKNTGGGQP